MDWPSLRSMGTEHSPRSQRAQATEPDGSLEELALHSVGKVSSYLTVVTKNEKPWVLKLSLLQQWGATVAWYFLEVGNWVTRGQSSPLRGGVGVGRASFGS